ncbi:MAG TPA: RNA methyltransferase [Candidatus Avacidaminococcus intestinavium]|uniref:RNA methyltransferase n=1 Tax=Candidatus Avacidaminococcus intestinavium TaxID=2840684 RepID=A0A9D1MNU8_9FIRM|nr:RNA methyltransferase [Candidatus Avacidaminococcus intestinavium]
MSDLYIGLLHYPVYNKNMKVIATAVTNFDIHDIARTARTYNVKKYFLVHPLEEQKKIIDKIINYWRVGFGKTYNPDRNEALSIVNYAESIEAMVAAITKETGVRPLTVTTDARHYPNTVNYQFVRELLEIDGPPLLLLFGTGFGIEQSVMNSFNYILEPVEGNSSYNHLCVRSAVAIILDRLAGSRG